MTNLFSFFNSLVFGKEGNYRIPILNTNVKFTSSQGYTYRFSKADSNLFIKIPDIILSSRIFHLLSFSNLHTFIHEMGHTISSKILFKGNDPKIDIYTNSGVGCTKNINPSQLSFIGKLFGQNFSKTIVDASGSITDLLFSAAKIMIATCYYSKITAIAAAILAFGGTFYIAGEALYTIHSIVNMNHGDYGKIAKRSTLHLLIASTAFVAAAYLGISPLLHLRS